MLDISERPRSVVELGKVDNIQRPRKKLSRKKVSKKSGKFMTKKRANTLVTLIREFVDIKLSTQLKSLSEGIKNGQLAQAIDSLEHEGVDRIDSSR